jgi:hypothetical protein
VTAALLAPRLLAAQAADDPTLPTTAAVHRLHAAHALPTPEHLQAAPAPVDEPPAPVAAAAPEAPRWPMNDHPTQAAVTWDSRGLSIDATNSSLQQILRDFSTATGSKIDGIGEDQRIFGVYGPGQARDVLSQLLQGSGYNVIMIGDLGQGAPREILLSPRQNTDTQTAANHNGGNNGDDEATEPDVEEQQVPPPMPVRPGFTPGQPRTPQQMLQERQQQMQQMQQMRQNQPQN